MTAISGCPAAGEGWIGGGRQRMRRVKRFEPGMPARDYLIASLGGMAILGLLCAAWLVTA